MKKYLKKLLLRYKYPQYLFTRQINKRIKYQNLKKNDIIIDAPCGDGQTSYWLAKENVLAQVYGFDIDVELIGSIPIFFKQKNLQFDSKDIFTMLDDQEKKVNVFCIINSLFLLPNNPLLIEKISQRLCDEGHLFFIIPNIYSNNYKNFMKTKESVINIYEYSVDSLIAFIGKYGYSHIFKAPLVYAYFYGRRELKYTSYLTPFYLYFLNFIQMSFKIGQPSYWIMEFKKQTVS